MKKKIIIIICFILLPFYGVNAIDKIEKIGEEEFIVGLENELIKEMLIISFGYETYFDNLNNSINSFSSLKDNYIFTPPYGNYYYIDKKNKSISNLLSMESMSFEAQEIIPINENEFYFSAKHNSDFLLLKYNLENKIIWKIEEKNFQSIISNQKFY